MAVEVSLGKPRPPEEYRDTLVSALEECERLGRIIDSLLFIARAEDPRTQINREPLDVVEELGRVCEFFDASAVEAKVTLKLECAGPLPAELDRTLFQRAIANLVSNALDHTPAGGRVVVSARHLDGQVQVEVVDDGAGIGTDDLPRLFERFYRADTARSGHHFGLGLAIVKTITTLHGGEVGIESTRERGTRVWLRLPMTAAEANGGSGV